MKLLETNRVARISFALVLCMAASSTLGREQTSQVSAALVPGVSLWDTLAPSGHQFSPNEKPSWRAIPEELLCLESNAATAISDPGYYGRAYDFAGDAVVETPRLAAVFGSAKGCVSIYSTQASSGWSNVADVTPVLTGSGPVTMEKQILRHADDEVVLKVSFSQPGSERVTGMFSFGRTGIVEVDPGTNMQAFRVTSPMAYGVVPAFIGDDLIYGGSKGPTNVDRVAVPCEGMFLGLLQGENNELVITWPEGQQRMSLHFARDQVSRSINSVDFDCAGQSFYLAALSARGIWHKQTLSPDGLEQDVKIDWKPPFPARWKTELSEQGLTTTYAFRPYKSRVWRGVASFYDYPVWFDGDQAFFHISKKVQPEADTLIYGLEARDTPLTIQTPAGILKDTLGRQAAGHIFDYAGRHLRTHHRRGAAGVRRACTCGCTEVIQAVFNAGKEANEKDSIQADLDDMVFFVRNHVERIREYRLFADKLLKQIQDERRSSPELKPYLDSVEKVVQEIPRLYEEQKEGINTPEYMDNLYQRTLMLASANEPDTLKKSQRLLQDWRDMGSAQDYTVAKCHIIGRQIFRAAGYDCAALPEAVPFAQKIRAECRQILRTPDGYEIWANY